MENIIWLMLSFGYSNHMITKSHAYFTYYLIVVMFERSCCKKINITFDFNLFNSGTNLHDYLAKTCPCGTSSWRWRWTSTRRCSTSGQAAPRTHPRSLPNEVTIPSSHPNVQGEAKADWVLRCRTCWTVLGEASLPQTTSNSLSRPCQEQTNSEGNFADSSKQID